MCYLTDQNNLAIIWLYFSLFMCCCLLLQLAVVWIAETSVFIHFCSQSLFMSDIHYKNVFMCLFISSLLACCKMENDCLTQFVLDGFQDAVGVTQHAGCCRTDLNEIFSHGLTQEHCVKCRYFIHSHWRDFQNLSDLDENNYKHSVRSPYMGHRI